LVTHECALSLHAEKKKSERMISARLVTFFGEQFLGSQFLEEEFPEEHFLEKREEREVNLDISSLYIVSIHMFFGKLFK